MKKTIKNTVKFNKLLEHIQRLLIKTIGDQTISYEDIADLKTRANLLFDIYNNPKTGNEKKHKKQSGYFKYLLYIKNKKKNNGKRTQATPPTLSVRD